MYNFEIGDHLITERELYVHHGIYMGSGMVIEYARVNGVQIVNLEDFAERYKIGVVKHKDAVYFGDEVVQRALSRVGESRYNLLFNNCEHFCNWAITGVTKSEQVQDVFSTVGEAVFGAMLSKTKFSKADIATPAVAMGVAKAVDLTFSKMYSKNDTKDIDLSSKQNIENESEKEIKKTKRALKEIIKDGIADGKKEVNEGIDNILFEGYVAKKTQELTGKYTDNEKIKKAVGATTSLASIGITGMACSACVTAAGAVGASAIVSTIAPIVLSTTAVGVSYKTYKNVRSKFKDRKEELQKDSNDYTLKKRSKLEDVI